MQSLFSLAKYARYAAEQDEKYITKIKYLGYCALNIVTVNLPKDRGIDVEKEDNYMPQYIYHALFRHERVKGSI